MLFLAADDVLRLPGLNKSNADRTGDASSIAFSILIIKLFTNDLQTMIRKCKMLFSMSPSFQISTALFVCLASNIASTENSRGLLACSKYFNSVSADPWFSNSSPVLARPSSIVWILPWPSHSSNFKFAKTYKNIISVILGDKNWSQIPLASGSFLLVKVVSTAVTREQKCEIMQTDVSLWVTQQVVHAFNIFTKGKPSNSWVFLEIACLTKLYLKVFHINSNKKSTAFTSSYSLRRTKHRARLWFQQLMQNTHGNTFWILLCRPSEHHSYNLFHLVPKTVWNLC